MIGTTLSIVIPAYNERDSLPALLDEIAELNPGSVEILEVLVVDDGSTDGSDEVLAGRAHSWLRVIRHPRNLGQTAALASGFAEARGDLVATLDADLQNDPADIPRLVDVMRESGADMVTGVRVGRRDTLWKRVQSRIGNLVRDWITGDRVTDTGCTLRLAKREVVDGLLEFDGSHRFIPTLAKMRGARVVEAPVRHRARRFGTSKYGVWNRAATGLAACVRVRRLRGRVIR